MEDIEGLCGALTPTRRRRIHGLEEVGVCEARLDGVDVDLVAGVLERRRARQLQHRALGRAVARRPAQARACENRRKVDDPAARRRVRRRFLSQELPHRVLRPQPHPPHVHRQRRVQNRHRRLVDPRERPRRAAVP